MKERPENCQRCGRELTGLWFHKSDEFEDVYICQECLDAEYGPWLLENDNGDK